MHYRNPQAINSKFPTPSKATWPSQTFVEHCVHIQADVSEVNLIEHLYSVPEGTTQTLH